MAAITAMLSCMKKNHFFQGIILCALLTSILLFLSSFWFPSMEGLVLDMKNSIVADANCLFVVVNLIIAVLVGESKLGGGGRRFRSEMKRPSAADNNHNGVYDEYVERKTRRIRKSARERNKDGDVEVRERKMEEREDGDYDDGDGLEKEELNRRVEEFIARVNEQRWVEARAF